jgi:hypothetical protein
LDFFFFFVLSVSLGGNGRQSRLSWSFSVRRFAATAVAAATEDGHTVLLDVGLHKLCFAPLPVVRHV